MSLQDQDDGHQAFKMIMLLAALLLLLRLPVTVSKQLIEQERVRTYHENNYTWPPADDEFIPNSDGWRRLMQRRFDQVQRIEDSGDQYNGWVSTVHTALISQNFTLRTPAYTCYNVIIELREGLECLPHLSMELML